MTFCVAWDALFLKVENCQLCRSDLRCTSIDLSLFAMLWVDR